MKIQSKSYTMLDLIKIPMSICPVQTMVKFLDKGINALLPSLQVLITAKFVNTAVAIFGGSAPRRSIYLPLALIALVVLYQKVRVFVRDYIDKQGIMKLNETFLVAVVEKRAKLEYRHVEDNETWDLLERVGKDPSVSMIRGLDRILNMGNIFIRVGALLSLLFVEVWWAAVIVLVCAVPLLYLAIKGGKSNYKAFREASKYSRRANYFQDVLSSRENVEERSLFGYTDTVNRQWYDKFEIARKINLKNLTKDQFRMNGASFLVLVLTLPAVLALLQPLAAGSLSIGMFMGLSTALFNLSQTLGWELSFHTSGLAKAREYLKDFSRFATLSETDGALEEPIPPAHAPESIELDRVSFRYPGTEQYILKECSMRLEGRRHYAFVGVNGAGKTTITKLLCGLYPDYEGEIRIDGRNLKSFSQGELKGLFTVVYQDFSRYAMTLRENIALGNLPRATDERVEQAAALVGLDEAAKELPLGYDTPLCKVQENATDLSGGQWQRVALARAVLSDAPVYILDEPTAALDPMAESKVYEMFGEISAGRMTIFITHRLGAAKLADEILVLEDGRVVERGTHRALMKEGGLYHTMFEAQRSWYQ